MRWFKHWFGRPPRAAEIRHAQNRKRLEVESLEERQVPTVLYYGGNVLPHVEAQALFLGNKWSSVPADAAQTATVNSFLTNVTGGAYMDALTRAGYGVGRGSASPGAVDNVSIPDNAVISDAGIQNRIQQDINSGLLQTPDSNRLYLVYVEPNVAVNLGVGQETTQQGILGYHGAFSGRDASGNASVIRYAVIAYPGGSVRNSSMGTQAVDQRTAVTSHELAEAVTDPDVNYGRLGWYDPRRGEIGDISANSPNALVRLGNYLVQEVVDKNDQLLQIPVNQPPVTPPTTPPVTTPITPPASRTTTTSTLGAGSVYYPWHRFGFPIVTLTVTIAPGSGLVVPDGRVALLNDGRVLGISNVTVVNGVATATFSVQFFARGSFSFNAQYLGSSQFQGSLSNAVTVNV